MRKKFLRRLRALLLGCAFNYSLTRDPQRIAILLLIHALATFVAWLAALSIALTTQVPYMPPSSIRLQRSFRCWRFQRDLLWETSGSVPFVRFLL